MEAWRKCRRSAECPCRWVGADDEDFGSTIEIGPDGERQKSRGQVERRERREPGEESGPDGFSTVNWHIIPRTRTRSVWGMI